MKSFSIRQAPVALVGLGAAMRRRNWFLPLAVFVVLLAVAPQDATGQEAALAWNQVQYFSYNILNVSYDGGTRTVTVVFSVTNPRAGNAPYDILGTTAATAFKPPATLRIDISWNAGSWGTTELVNTKDAPLLPTIRTISTTGVVTGSAPASAVAVNALSAAVKRCSDPGSPCSLFQNANLTYLVKSVLPAAASGAGRVGIEGHPSVQTGVDPVLLTPIYASIPVKSVYRDFPINGAAVARRQVVDITKCMVCHDNRQHGETIVPRLSLHGANRNEETGVCVMCHNPNQTDAAYRTSGAEESVDFKRMIHGIHAGGMRKNPLIIIGRNGSVNDFSHVRFPTSLRNCLNCHVEVNQRGTFELPMSTTLGSAISTLSVLNNPLPGQVDIDPSNDLRISPTAATCSGCHDDSETRRHMTQMGASFGVVQSVLAGREQCVNCHGPGKSRDVRKEHGLLSSRRSDD